MQEQAALAAAAYGRRESLAKEDSCEFVQNVVTNNI